MLTRTCLCRYRTHGLSKEAVRRSKQQLEAESRNLRHIGSPLYIGTIAVLVGALYWGFYHFLNPITRAPVPGKGRVYQNNEGGFRN